MRTTGQIHLEIERWAWKCDVSASIWNPCWRTEVSKGSPELPLWNLRLWSRPLEWKRHWNRNQRTSVIWSSVFQRASAMYGDFSLQSNNSLNNYKSQTRTFPCFKVTVSVLLMPLRRKSQFGVNVSLTPLSITCWRAVLRLEAVASNSITSRGSHPWLTLRLPGESFKKLLMPGLLPPLRNSHLIGLGFGLGIGTFKSNPGNSF